MRPLPRLLCLLVALLSGLFPAAHAQSRVECNAIKSRILKQTVHYCAMLPPSYDSTKQTGDKYPVLYFLHGLGGNEQDLVNNGGWGLLNDLRSEHKVGEFLVVTPEARRTFYINSADGLTNYSDFFVREFIPFIESHYRILAEAKTRGITGSSMGGYGALRFAFAYPGMFSSVSAQSPALITDSPQQLNAAVKSGMPLSGVLEEAYGNPIDAAHWRQNSPIVLAEQNSVALRKLAIYLNCGNNDDFGFEKGTKKLHEQLNKKGITHEYHLYPGNHDISYFLAHLPETLEFHSRHFQVIPK